jgi:hypothetical protein
MAPDEQVTVDRRKSSRHLGGEEYEPTESYWWPLYLTILVGATWAIIIGIGYLFTRYRLWPWNWWP